MALRERIKARALELGFDVVGIGRAAPAEHLPFYLDWLAAGYHGSQDYLARPDRVARRQDLEIILPGARSVVVVGLHYWPGPPPPEASEPGHGRLSSYALGPDYHRIMLPMLEALLDFARTEVRGPAHGRAYVDTGPLLERDHGLAAGLGFVGKNCNLIRPRHGSWLFLGILLLDIPLEPDLAHELGTASPRPFQPSCGRCTRCLEACPTGALVHSYTLDSRRCISYFTTALKGAIPREFRRPMGNHLFGCDVCQNVCPWNRFARPVELSPLAASRVDPGPSLLELIDLSATEFDGRYGHTPIGHRGHELFLRNVAVALGNWGAAEAVPALGRAMGSASPLVRQHVAWSLGEIGGAAARSLLEKALAREPEPAVMEEIGWSLAL